MALATKKLKPNTPRNNEITIGDNCTIGGSVVTHDIPANSIVAGNPAKVIKMIQ